MKYPDSDWRMQKIGRNALCSCGSGKKYKHCCMRIEPAGPATGQEVVTSAMLLQEALAQHQGGNLSEAKKRYLQILQNEPAHADALYLLGLVAHAQGEAHAAIELMTKAIAVNSINPDYYANLGVVLQETGKLEAAAENYRLAIARKPEYAEAHNNLANTLKEQGKSAEAIISYRRALEIMPESAMILYNLANALLEQNEQDGAIAYYRRALALKPDYAEAHNNLGNALQSRLELDAAIGCYRQAIACDPGYVEACNNLGNALKDKGNIDEAIASYRQALAVRPDYAVLHYNLGNALKQQGKPEQAALSYRQAIACRPDYAEAYNNLGNALKESSRLDDAVASYRRALDLKPEYAEAHNNLGSTLQVQGKLDDAIASYRRAMTLNPDSVEVHNNLGCALQESGELVQAIACYDRALQIKPDSAETHYNLAGIFQAQARLDEAIAGYRRALDLKPDYAEAHNNLGNALKDRGFVEEADASYKRALACKTDAQTLCNLGILYSKAEQYALAEEWYRRALEVDALSVVAHRNLSAILVNDGRTAEARMHMDAAYRRQCWFSSVSATARRTVLILLGVEKGNVPVGHLFPPEVNNTIEWMVEYAAAGQQAELPAYDAVFNAVGEPDMTGNTSAPIAAFIANSVQPLLNRPEAIARTARHLMPALLGEVEDVIVPAVWRIEPGNEFPENLPFPLLVRPAGSHGGEQMKRLATASELRDLLAAGQGEIVYASAYYDYRSADGYFRKYRTIFIDGEAFPYHLAISPHWMVHYATAEMQDVAWKLAEERQFLENPARVLGSRGTAAVAAIGRKMKLDYAGADFTLLPDGRILLFEANATMLIHPEKEQTSLAFKNPYVQRIVQAFEDLLARKTALSRPNRRNRGYPSSPDPSADER